MIENNTSPAPDLTLPEVRRDWWNTLSGIWKSAFLESFYQKKQGSDDPSDSDLARLCSSSVLRIVGKEGMHSNFSGSISNLEGLRRLTSLEILFVMHCGLESLAGIEDHAEMRSLFVNNNALSDISQIREMANLQELYIGNNQIQSIEPVKHCRMLHTLCCENNLLISLDGIRPFHEKHLRVLRCKPNESLPQREIIRVQNDYGILCQ